MHLFATALEFLGTLCIAIAALSVHHRFLNEHRVDDKVLSTMKREQKIGFVGVFLVSIGFALNMFDVIV